MEPKTRPRLLRNCSFHFQNHLAKIVSILGSPIFFNILATFWPPWASRNPKNDRNANLQQHPPKTHHKNAEEVRTAKNTDL